MSEIVWHSKKDIPRLLLVKTPKAIATNATVEGSSLES